MTMGCSPSHHEEGVVTTSARAAGVEGRAWVRVIPDAIFRVERLAGPMLEDPQACQTCHPDHLSEWASGPHAFASTDGVFDAMHRAGQEGSGGAIEDFCFRCHAPAAHLRRKAQTRRRCLELTGGCEEEDYETEITPIADLGEHGVSCVVCHELSQIHALENAEISIRPGRLALDDADVHAHNTRDWLRWESFDAEVQERLEQACAELDVCVLDPSGEPPRALRVNALCGSCHEVISPRGVAVEETFSEWLDGGYAATGKTCVDCHMRQVQGPVARSSTTRNQRHTHRFAGVDIPLDLELVSQFLADAAGDEAARAYAERAADEVQTLLATAARMQATPLDVQTLGSGRRVVPLDVRIDNLGGHSLPSGATQEREMWVRVRAFADDAAEPFYVRGDVGPTEALSDGLCEAWDEEGFHCVKQNAYEPGLRIYRSVFFKLAENTEERALLVNALAQPRAPSPEHLEPLTALVAVLGAAGVDVGADPGVAVNAQQAFWDHFAQGRCNVSFSKIYYRQPEEREPNYAFKSRRVGSLYREGQLDVDHLEALRALTFTRTSSGSRPLFVDTAEAAAHPERDLRWNVLPPRRRALGHDLQSVRAPLPTPELIVPVDFPWDADGNMNCTIPAGGSAHERLQIPLPPEGATRVRVEVSLVFRAFPPNFLRALKLEKLLGEGSMLRIFVLDEATLEVPIP